MKFDPFYRVQTRQNTGLRGILIFKKDNPTDRPELDDALDLPVSFW
jgi:hypothetical protein